MSASSTTEPRLERGRVKPLHLDKAGAFVREERDRASALIQEGLAAGPVAAHRKLVRGEFKAPWTVRVATLSGVPGTGSNAGALISLLSSMVAVPLALLFVTDVISDTPLVVQLAVIACIAIVTLAVSFVLYGLVLSRNRTDVMQQLAHWSLRDRAYWMALMVIVPTVGFAIVSAFGVRHHLFGLAGADRGTDDLSFAAFDTYLWNLAHAVPFLDIPETLKWKPSLDFREWYGGNLLVLLYKVALIVPLLQLLSLALKRVLTDEPARPR
jgi:hypothetical protein